MERIERFLEGRKSGDGLETEGKGSFKFLALAFGWVVMAFIGKRNSGEATGFRKRSIYCSVVQKRDTWTGDKNLGGVGNTKVFKVMRVGHTTWRECRERREPRTNQPSSGEQHEE